MTKTNEPSFETFPRLEALAFVCADGSFFCCDCANRRNGSLAFFASNFGDEDHFPRYSQAGHPDYQWRIIGAQFNDEPNYCAHCNSLIPSLGIGELPKFKLSRPND